MYRQFFAMLIVLFIFNGCTKNQQIQTTTLTGTWVKGSGTGDTLYFIQNNNKNIVRYNLSFNPTLAAFTEIEYRYQDKKLALKNFMAAQDDFYPIDSFRWLQEGREFEVRGYQLFPFMSSTMAVFTYRKIN